MRRVGVGGGREAERQPGAAGRRPGRGAFGGGGGAAEVTAGGGARTGNGETKARLSARAGTGKANTISIHTNVSTKQLATNSYEKSVEILVVDSTKVQTKKLAVDTTIKSSEAPSKKPLVESTEKKAETDIEKQVEQQVHS
ncbi:uncharacterized protein LOC131859044 [Cryptomeria japonica]|uniref:uncharacterized protein LOC131859044 n=1 Tax=Cryptomeria japonica TaxID=3369 RepID=UPI0027DA8A48|nr:uncharacterized protein LOC131859044 [Cryptomeria japonica]